MIIPDIWKNKSHVPLTTNQLRIRNPSETIALMVGRADLGSCSDQLLGNGGVAIPSCPMQRRVALALQLWRYHHQGERIETGSVQKPEHPFGIGANLIIMRI